LFVDLFDTPELWLELVNIAGFLKEDGSLPKADKAL
jgi:hypothetical protein